MSFGTRILQNMFYYFSTEVRKSYMFWNGMKMSKLWQNFNFGVNYSINKLNIHSLGSFQTFYFCYTWEIFHYGHTSTFLTVANFLFTPQKFLIITKVLRRSNQTAVIDGTYATFQWIWSNGNRGDPWIQTSWWCPIMPWHKSLGEKRK